MTDRLTDRNGLAVDEIEFLIGGSSGKSDLDQSSYNGAQRMQASDPLRIRAQIGKGVSKTGGNDLMCLLKSGASKHALHQCDGDDFRI